MEPQSTKTPQPASGVHRGKYRRRPPTSEAERERRKAWGVATGAKVSAFWANQRAIEAASERWLASYDRH